MNDPRLPTSGGDRQMLEELSDRAMPGADRQLLGSWILRASRGATSRANTVWPPGQPDRLVAPACDAVEQWYRDRGLVGGFQVWNGADAELVAELDRRHYRRAEGAVVMTRSLVHGPLLTDGTAGGVRATVGEVATPLVARLFTEPDRLAELLDSGLRKCFVTVSNDNGRLLGGGIGVLDRNDLGIFAMNTLPPARRLGVARRVLGELAKWGRDEGASAAWLQVMASNTPANRLYASCGFEPTHEYHYRLVPGAETSTPS